MIPVSKLEDVKVYWLNVRRQGMVLHGYLLYSGSDHQFPRYMSNDGIGDIDSWSGTECGIFVFQAPPEGWAAHATRSQHVWADLVRKSFRAEIAEKVASTSEVQISIGGRTSTLKDLYASCSDRYLNQTLIQTVLRQFSLPPTSHPCLILFKDLYGKDFWHVRLDDLLGKSSADLRKALKTWFGSKAFNDLIKEARRANHH